MERFAPVLRRVDRLLDSLPDVARSRLEAAAFTVLALGVVAVGLWGLRDTVVLWPPGPAAAGVLALGGVGVAVAARRAARLFLSSDNAVSGPSDLLSLPVLGVGSLVAGSLGACLELASSLAAVAAEGPAPDTTAALWGAVGTAAGTATLGVVAALVLALAWFWLAIRVRVVRSVRAELREIAPSFERETDGR